jgi:hypothetical protein
MSFFSWLFRSKRDFAQDMRDQQERHLESMREVDRQLREENKDEPRYIVKCASVNCTHKISIMEKQRKYYESESRKPLLCPECIMGRNDIVL